MYLPFSDVYKRQAAGVKIGSLFGLKYKAKAEVCGGIILIVIGAKILLEGLGIL